MLESVWRDFGYAARGLRKNTGFALTAALTLALGIGGNTAMFSIVRAVLLKPLDYTDPDQLVRLSGGATPTRFEDLKKNWRCFSGVAAFSGEESLTLTGGAEPELLRGSRVSANFLSILGVRPIIGRSFSAAEDSPDGPPVVLISAGLWSRRFNEDPHVAGKTMTLSEIPYTVIGVLPRGFEFPSKGNDVWMTRPSEWPVMPAKSRAMSPFLSLFGRLNSQVTIEQANAELTIVRHRYTVEHPAMLDAKAKSPMEAKLMKDELVTDVRGMLWMLFGAVGFVLMITCANVASLMLARAKSRSREFAVRAAIGASRLRLMTHVVAESLLLSMAGGVAGVLLAALSLRAIPFMTAFDLPRAAEIGVDWAVLLFAAALSIGTGFLFGMLPSFSASRPGLMNVLRGTGSAASDGRMNARNLLVVGQVAFSVVLLIGATLMIESILRLRGEHIGFDAANLLTLRVSLSPLRYDTEQKQAAFFAELVARVDSLPGIRSATAAMTLPMSDEFAGTPVQDAAKPPLRLNQRPIATIGIVTPGYFHTLEIPLRRGRDFTVRDKKDSERVAIIDEALARRFWPLYPAGQDPVGQQLLIGGVNLQPARIIGVVPAVHQNLENSAWPETVYVTFAQSAQPFALVAIRTEGDALPLTPVVRKLVRSMDRDLPISEVHSMEELMDAGLGRRRLVVGLLGSFAGVALVLALIGIYGVISYSVTQRIQELGIRWALGAQQGDILRLVMGQGVVLALAGIALGMAGAFWLTQFLKKMLFGASATDPVTFVGIGVMFILSALLASYIPARRATRIDPMAALRV